MDIAKFWHLIEESRQVAEGQCEEQVQALQDALTSLTAKEILAFDTIFHEMYALAFRWDLWGAAYVINGGCSDDCFDYFRGWLIAKGEIVFQQALADPDTLAEMIDADDLDNAECEELLYVTAAAYEENTGHELPQHKRPEPEIMGEPWEEGDLATLLPKLSAKYALLQQETSQQ